MPFSTQLLSRRQTVGTEALIRSSLRCCRSDCCSATVATVAFVLYGSRGHGPQTRLLAWPHIPYAKRHMLQ